MISNSFFLNLIMPIAKNLTLAHLTIGATPMDTINAAAAAGFGATGIRICGRRPGDPFATPVVGSLETIQGLRQRAADLGVRLSNVSGYQFYPGVNLSQVAPIVEATAELGIRVLVANGFDPDEARFTDIFSRYCELAEKAQIRVALEFLPYSGVRNLDAALRVIQASGSSSAGVLLDALHLERSGAAPDVIGEIPPQRIVFAQLCDALTWRGAKSDEALLQEARGARLPAGEGDLPLFDFLDALPEGCEIEYEVARKDMVERTPVEKAKAAAADAERFMTSYFSYQNSSSRS